MSTHDHNHDQGHHDHAGHSHGIAPDADQRWLALALAIIASFMAVEVVAGLLADSLALLSDAAHMLTDAASIALALAAAWLAARPAKSRYTFGLGRAEILSAQVNGATLLALAAVIAFEAVRRLADPPDVEGAIVVVVGFVGAIANVSAALALARASRQSLNVAGARAHVMADLYGSFAAVAAGLGVLLLGLRWVDPLASLVVAALMLRTGWALVRDSGRVLLEGSPGGTDPDEVGHALAAHPGVRDVQDLHVWEITSGFPALSAHVLVGPEEDCHDRKRDLQRLLHRRFAIDHVTLQVDHEGDDHVLELTPAADRARPGCRPTPLGG